MNFKEALIAHLDHQDVRVTDCHGVEHKFFDYFRFTQLQAMHVADSSMLKFRIAPRTIIVNGVEVPAPESEYPAPGTEVYVVALLSSELVERTTFRGSSLEMDWLNRGLIYINEEDAIARAKAMLITKEV